MKYHSSRGRAKTFTMSLEIDKKIMELFDEDQEATYRTSCVDSKKNTWTLPKKLKDYVIGTFYEDKSLGICEITMTDGRVITLKMQTIIIELRDKIKEKILDNVTGVYHLEFNAGNELEEMLNDIMSVIDKIPTHTKINLKNKNIKTP